MKPCASDGLTASAKTIDDESYMIRFSPRKPESIWSAVNIRNVERLSKEKRMQPAGLKAFAAKKEYRSGIYAYEQRPAELVEPYASQFRRNKAAWKFFQAQPPYYRKTLTWWIVSAKQEETRLKRLEKLIEISAKGKAYAVTQMRKVTLGTGSTIHRPKEGGSDWLHWSNEVAEISARFMKTVDVLRDGPEDL